MMLGGLLADARHATRIYVRTPLATGFAVGGLALAIACVAALLTLFSDLMLKPHSGYRDGRELITVGQTSGTRYMPLSYELVERIDQQVVSVQGMSGVYVVPLDLSYQGTKVQVPMELVSREFFPTLKPFVQMGRGFNEQDHQANAEPVAVLSHDAWGRYFGGDPGVLGQVVTVSGKPHLMSVSLKKDSGGAPSAPGEQSQSFRIVGVMAPASSGSFGTNTAVWLPYERASGFVAAGATSRRAPVLHAIGRLSAGASVDTVRDELSQRFKNPPPELGIQANNRLDTMEGVVQDVLGQRDAQQQVRLFLAGGVLLVLVAAANVSLFLLSRAPSRQRELSIRTAVGATLRRLMQQLVTEAAVLVFAATILGWMLSIWLAFLLQQQALLARAQWRTASAFDWRVLLMISACACLLTFLVALAPTLGLLNRSIAAGAKMTTARAGWGQRLAGTAQIAVAGVVVSAALAFGWHLHLMANADLGFRSSNVLVVSTRPKPGQVMATMTNSTDTAIRRARYRDVIERIPGVDSVGFGSSIPGRMAESVIRLESANAPEQLIDVPVAAADENFRRVLSMQLLQGSDLNEREQNSVLVNETFAKTLFGRSTVVGEVIASSGMTIAGVLKDAAFVHPSAEVRPMIFRTATPFSVREWILVSTQLSAVQLRQQLARYAESGDLDFEVADVEPLVDVWNRTLASDNARTALSGMTAAVVVLLAALGFYSTQTYLVSAGKREYAIRAAVGAGPKAIGRLVFSRALTMGAPGLGLAACLGLLAVEFLKEGFVTPLVRPVYVVVVAIVALIGLVLFTTWGPARHARSTEPAPLLRED